jgi:hypothetical protein
LPSITYGELERRAALRAGLGSTGTIALVATSQQVAVNERPEDPGFWDGAHFVAYLPGGTQSAVVTDWTPPYLMLSAPISGLAPGTPYMLLKGISYESLKESARQALREVWPYFSTPVVKLMTIGGGQFTYPFDDVIEPWLLYRVELQPHEAFADYPWRRGISWRYSSSGTAIELPPQTVYAFTGRQLRLVGCPRLPDPLVSGTVLSLEQAGDDGLLVSYVAGAMLVQVGITNLSSRLSDQGAAQGQIAAGQLLMRAALEPVRMRRRPLAASETMTAWG